MPVSLLKSQFDELEPLQLDEDGVDVTVSMPPEEVVATVLKDLGLD